MSTGRDGFGAAWAGCGTDCTPRLTRNVRQRKIKIMKRDYYSFLKNRKPEIIGETVLHQSAVAIVLPEGTEEDEILFEVRSDKIKDQPGDICLPGGGVEPGETPREAVIREMKEELLVCQEQIEVVAPVSIFVTGSLEIHVFLCRLKDYRDTFDTDEVAEVFRVPAAFFEQTRPEIHEVFWNPDMGKSFPYDKIYGGRHYAWREHKNQVRFYEYAGRVIWGITARIMDYFSDMTGNKSGSISQDLLQKNGQEVSPGVSAYVYPKFPFFTDIAGKNILVVGGGRIAKRRIRILLLFGPQITVVAPEMDEDLKIELADIDEETEIRAHKADIGRNFSVCWKRKDFEDSDIDGMDMVLAATDNGTVNRHIVSICKETGIPVNASDRQEDCDFHFPSVVLEDDIVVGITGDGTDHAKVRRTRETIQKALKEKDRRTG